MAKLLHPRARIWTYCERIVMAGDLAEAERLQDEAWGEIERMAAVKGLRDSTVEELQDMVTDAMYDACSLE